MSIFKTGLLSGIDGIDLRNQINNNQQIEIDSLISGVSDRFEQWLTQMVQLSPDNRFDSAVTALETLSPIDIVPSLRERKYPRINKRKIEWQD